MNDVKEMSDIHTCSLDIEFDTGIAQARNVKPNDGALALHEFERILSHANISADPKKNAHYRTGWRSGGGSALAVLFPQTLVELWEIIKVSVSQNLIIVMQAANTGLTEGSTPSGNDYDRPVVVINTLALDDLYLLNQGKQVISMPGATLHKLEQSLTSIQRAPHSVIGSSCLGASIVGGIANNSGGALVKRGPAYTELSVFAKIDEHGKLILVNHMGVFLGNTPDELILNLSTGNFAQENLQQGTRQASDESYQARIKDVDADTPSRFNADPRRLYESSGCAGKIAVFAVRVDSHPVAKKEASFYIGTNNPEELYDIRRALLSELDELPDIGEYMHRDIFDVAEIYGKDTFLSVLHLGTQRLPKMFELKGRIDSIFNNISWMPSYLSDKVMQQLSRLFPQHLPNRMREYRHKYEHHLTLKLSDNAITQGRQVLHSYFANSNSGSFFECTPDEAKRAYLHRFSAAGAAMRYQTIHAKELGDILSLDIALPRNEKNWVEAFPAEIEQQLDKKLYYGHFFCHVFHQDYVLKKGVDPIALKQKMLALLDSRGAKYPAEHNVGHLYEAEGPLKQFYKQLDPSNSFNPGVGKMEKHQRNCQCCL
jgi:D-lactate dehydrogenase